MRVLKAADVHLHCSPDVVTIENRGKKLEPPANAQHMASERFIAAVCERGIGVMCDPGPVFRNVG